MAGENLGTVNSALSQIFADPLQRQWNRTALFLNRVQAKAAPGSGKNVAFDTEFSGNTAQTVAEGSDVQASEYASDINMPAILPWAHYRSSFQITETELDSARTSVGTPRDLQDLFGDRILGAGAQIARKIETDCMTGTGVDINGNPTIVGIYSGALIASGAYAGINAVTFPEWASNLYFNGGSARSLTVDLMDQADAGIFTSSSEAWNMAMTSAGVSRKYGGMFTAQGAGAPATPLIRMNDGPQNPQYGLQSQVSFDGQLNQFYRGAQVLRNAVNPIGKLALLNTNYVKIKYLPRVMTPQDAIFAQMLGLSGSTGVGGDSNGYVQATSIPARVAILAKTGDSTKVSVKVTLQMCITRPNACAILGDLLEN